MTKFVGIVGVGPRGVRALESLIFQSQKVDFRIEVLLFEKSNYIGSGPVYAPDQSEGNWLNISERALELKKREKQSWMGVRIPSFPSYHAWSGFDPADAGLQDVFPHRGKIGIYLRERYWSMAVPLQHADLLSMYNSEVLKIEYTNKPVIILSNQTYEVDEVILTIGHHETEEDPQLSKWRTAISGFDQPILIAQPYPFESIMNQIQVTEKNTIALRGMGLAAIDVIRNITTVFGDFQNTESGLKYVKKFDSSLNIIPFSLDGLPPSPKPLNASIDQMYLPEADVIHQFENAISTMAKDGSLDNSATRLVDCIAPVVASIFMEHNDNLRIIDYPKSKIIDAVKAFLLTGRLEHDLMLDHASSTVEIMKAYVSMSKGESTCTLDYCIGQVWRHLQPTMYRVFSYSQMPNDQLARIIELDEGTKRYSFGPPTESVEQLISLVEADVLNFVIADDPSIVCNDSGWSIKDGKNMLQANIMINTVLSPPKVEVVCADIIQNLLSSTMINIAHDKMGIMTSDNGHVMSESPSFGVSLMGRLAKGTVYGVDAILDCFGPRMDNWAKGAINRMSKG